MVEIRDAAPQFCLPGMEGQEVCLDDFKGKWLVLYFYPKDNTCLLYTSDAADDLLCVDLGGRRIIKKKTKKNNNDHKYKIKQNQNLRQ